ncbi:MAG: polysaccharide biosynthesis protein [uncultured bacterium]|uniref:Uncharacterized protein n=1 Tax=Candidatus Woesebacteria bacterium RIFCSPHIGHO2_12_FULL_41_24 TaxID=1802510 RepID=A0A1F8AQJ7_9BACT|nr:MAG: polysaccharide biosynthesis protein [uncultured bacterium]OGM14438.1 MAG: hypothetical protein A2W15_00315 [Candidatus Woesebacteria bacterium RBG_16_41_13]OGM28491.1 MAG: hypothetical protein A2873_04475 [Candidatus Woesebacteria bacterium RIFCSPHIGHO2_01_FULL_42_80]OGM35500.1 MAG: hypothetical protein A3D84_05510 [Candidatus Woesebacteria bacterium RIFCSPHIGHO2_02_FULL_42_20]OGM54043.1 MAG: hypothetical protein A3E44_02580 [Candidatus Woesebacteria bacterium RIFCSPHIGHO2_12_FULL_41_24
MVRQDIGEHLNPTDEITLEAVKSRAVKGVVALTGRTLVLNIISLFAQGLLWAFLSPEQFGVFLIVSATINFLSYFADIGLGAALIQKREKPTEADFKTVFIVQETLVVTITLLVFLISPVLARTHNLTYEGIALLYALTISFFLASLKNIPSIILERKLEFGKFIIPQVVEQVVYNVAVVFFAWRGFGITSFTYAVLIRGVIGVVTIYILQPWKPGLAFSKASLKGLLRFGIPYQLNNFLATIKDDGMTIVLGGVLGSAGLGILGTAQKLAQYPLRFFMDNVTKVTFPAFSRMQDDKTYLERSLTRSLFFICALVFPSLVGLSVLFPVLVTVIPRYGKWASAYIPFLLISINSMFAAGSTQLTNLLNSIGRIKTTFKLMVMWTVLTWAILPFLSIVSGAQGAALGYAVVGASSVVVFYLVKRVVNFSFYYSVVKPLFASGIMGAVLLAARGLFSWSFLGIGMMVVIGITFYALVIYLLVGKSAVEDVKKVFATFSRK